jgi:hypothetical protein
VRPASSRLVAAILLAVLAIGSERASAGEGAALEPGARVRGATLDRVRFSGRLVSVDAETIAVARDGEPERLLSREAIERLEVHTGRSSLGHRILAGAGQGATIGGLSGVIVGLASGNDHCGSQEFCIPAFEFSAGQKAAVAGIVFGTLGAALGAIVGTVSRGERWERVRPRASQVSVELEPVRRGAGLAVRYSF